MRFSAFPSLAVVGGVLLAGAGIWWMAAQRSGDSLAALAERLGTRPSPGRLSRLLQYSAWAPYDAQPLPPVADAVEPGPANRGGQRFPFVRLQRAADREPSPENLQVLATALLLAGERAAAVGRLEQALRLAPDRPELWSDLSAAHLALFASADGASSPGDRAFAAVRALGAAEHALALRDDLREALFNRALAFEVLHLDRQAGRAWRTVRDAERRDSGWRSEAETAIERLERPSPAARWSELRRRFLDEAAAGDTGRAAELVAASLAGARDDVALELLGAWAKAAAEAREADAAVALDAVRAIGELLAEGERDRLLADTVAEIEAAGGDRRGPFSSRLDRIVAGLTAFDDGLALYRANRYGAARARFEIAEAELEAASSCFAGMATRLLAVCAFYANDYDGADALLRDLRSRIDADRDPALVALTARMIGLIGFNRADLGESLGLWLEADDAFQRAGDLEGRGGIYSLLASGYDLLGLTDRAWSYRLAALDLLADTTSPRRAVSLLGRSGDAAADAGEMVAGLAFHDEAVAVAEARGGPLEVAVARHSRGRIRALLGDTAGAGRDFAAAWASSRGLGDGDLKNSLAAEIHRSEGTLPPTGNGAEAIAAQTQAIEFFQTRPKKLFIIESYAARARGHLASGDPAAAEEDLRAALAEIEAVRGRVDGEEARIAFLDLERRQRVVDDLVELVAADRPDEALAVVERGRARALLDRLGVGESGDGDPATEPESAEAALARLPAELPSQTAMLVYHALPERLLIWVIDRRGVRPPISAPVGAAELAVRVAELRDALRGHAADKRFRDVAGGLYDLLLGEPLAAAGDVEHLVIVPDKALHLAPFAALYDPVEERYLLETATVSLAPSLRVYLGALDRSRGYGRARAATILAVGDPDFDRTLFPTFRPLPDARIEAAAIAELYSQRTVLIGANAHHDAVLAELGAHEVLHLGTHAVVNPESAHGSALLLAPSGGGAPGPLSAAEIAGIDLSGVRLAVLAACDTGTGAVHAGEGVVSLARAFLAAGVPAVVQSLWAIEDATTAELLVDFHSRLRAGADPATALRQAQLSFLRSDDPGRRRASAWGALVVVGGVEPVMSDSDERRQPWTSP